jgi:hypothetical protein
MLDENVDIGTFEGRLAVLDDLYNRFMRVIEERGVAYGDDSFGKTGLYTRKFKIGGNREFPMIVEEYAMDRGLLRELLKVRHAEAKERKFSPKKDRKYPYLLPIEEYTAILNAGRDRVAQAQKERLAAAAAKEATQADESPEK